MLGATNLGGTFNVQDGQPAALVPSTKYLCNSCQISFSNGQDQRDHMKEPWQYKRAITVLQHESDQSSVYNVKKRIASLPPISRNQFDADNKAKPEKKLRKTGNFNSASTSDGSSESKSEEETEEDERTGEDIDETDNADDGVSPFQCLFCNHSYAKDDAGFTDNLEHMLTTHGLFIPDPDLVADLPSFISYLATEVRIWHECLYCGATKSSTLSIQSHMRDKGHCLLNFDREPELLDFWEHFPLNEQEISPTDRPINMSETEILFANGKVVGSRHATPVTRRPPKAQDLAVVSLPRHREDEKPLPLPTGPKLASSRQLVRRDEMGLVGISSQQRQALVLAEKKAQRGEMMARKAREWVYARGSNSQKFDQIDGSGKWGKQNHKLQPR